MSPKRRPAHFGQVVSRIAHASLLERPNQMPSEEWWRRLEPGFAMHDEDFALEWADRWRVEATALSDLVVRSAAASAVGALALPLGYHPKALRQDLADEGLYARAAEARDPDLFFAQPPDDVAVHSRPARLPSFEPAGGEVIDLSFESPFVPVNPRLHGRWLEARPNRTAHARWWRHGDKPRAVVAAIHGFCADAYWLNAWFFQLPLLYDLGYDVLLFTLPFHGARQSALSPFSGHGFFSRGLSGINEAFAQAVYDFRIFFNHLEREHGVPALGVTGISLGGYTSALLAAVEPRLAFAMPNVPVVSIPDLMLEWHPMSLAVRVMLARTRSPISRFRRLLASACPLSYPPRLPRERLMIIGGVADRVVTPKHARLLWDHWGRCTIHWFPGSHLLHIDKSDYLTETARFFKRIGFTPEGLSPPQIDAPSAAPSAARS